MTKEGKEVVVQVGEIIDENMQELMNNIVVVMANRVLESSEGHMNPKLANPIAVQMLMSYLLDMLTIICAQNGIDIADVPRPDGGLETSITVRTRH